MEWGNQVVVQLKAVTPGDASRSPLQTCAPHGTVLPSMLGLLAFCSQMTCALTTFYEWDRVYRWVRFLSELVFLNRIIAV